MIALIFIIIYIIIGTLFFNFLTIFFNEEKDEGVENGIYFACSLWFITLPIGLISLIVYYLIINPINKLSTKWIKLLKEKLND